MTIEADDTSKGSRGAWIFVSHSNRDIEKVREIRNELERRGHNPVLFFLKCMEATEADDQLLWQLIEREIKAREWFVLCDSPNSRNSAAVLREMELVKSMTQEGKIIEIIDLSRDLETELHKIVRLSKRATVYLSYSRHDHEIADRIRLQLEQHGYSVWHEHEPAISAGADFAGSIRTAIDDAVDRGLVLVLLSPAALASEWCRWETTYALNLAEESQCTNVIPVLVAPIDRSELQLQLRYIQWFDLTTGQFANRVEELIHILKTKEMA